MSQMILTRRRLVKKKSSYTIKKGVQVDNGSYLYGVNDGIALCLFQESIYNEIDVTGRP